MHAPPAPAPCPTAPELVNDFAGAAPEIFVEMLTVPGFLNRVGHRFHMNEIFRFGGELGRAAESMHLAYMTAMDAKLGVLRVFPEPLMRRVYDVLAAQLSWPKIIDADTGALDDAQKAQHAIRANERMLKRLRELIADTDGVEQLKALEAAAAIIEQQTAELRTPTPETATATA